MYPDYQALNVHLAHIQAVAVERQGRGRAILEAFPVAVSGNAQQHNAYDEFFRFKNYDLGKALWADKTLAMADTFSGDAASVPLDLLGAEWSGKFLKMWQRYGLYAYETDPWRRSFRSHVYGVLSQANNGRLLRAMVWAVGCGFTLDAYLDSRADAANETEARHYEAAIVPGLIALELDEGNAALLERLRELVNDTAGAGMISRPIIAGLLMSRLPAAHELVASLLRAARLQEGLRQTILETMDIGSIEGFAALLKVVIDDNLLRFSSVVRGFSTWTGLALEVEKPAVIRKCFETAQRCLIDPAAGRMSGRRRCSKPVYRLVGDSRYRSGRCQENDCRSAGEGGAPPAAGGLVFPVRNPKQGHAVRTGAPLAGGNRYGNPGLGLYQHRLCQLDRTGSAG